jgi:hypothetical protein
MKEFPNLKQHPDYKAALEKQSSKIAAELIRRQEKFPFPGIRNSSYLKLQAEERELGEYMCNVNGIVEVIREFDGMGMEIRMGNNGRGICVMPAGSRDNKSSTLPPKHLNITESMHPMLKRLIKLDRMLSNE